MNNSYFVSAQWLKDHLDDENLVILDTTAPPPPQQIDCHKLWLDTHIPGAQFFDLDKIANHQSGLPHMLPDPQTFSQAVGAMGISENHLVVVYDQGNMFSAPRAWWTFKIFGSHNVRILNGGLQGWQQAGFTTESGEVTRSLQTFNTRFDASKVKSLQQILASLNDPQIQIVDARATDRFQAKAPEPRPGLRMGHIPGSKNVPWTMLVENGHFKSSAEITDIFRKQDVDLNKPVIASCGSGMTAAVLVLGLDIIGKKDSYLYDGSWAEWGANDALPLEK
ncbi:3-mercaptopyruvate sulfurtransferase [Photorhabdus heterorhabditis]|uniref:3-mercaptopyruvate sulfurtransferase n=1 Tax=Photorhabdus heterorhabditis TaxID=880156 RepID=UPI0015623E86|nr:3-mercaptopyruvate sulfurtransferase [Photorhabdus heterorhabditis]NRN28313.1 3-mercaptopyruvate sulfurtransferase [Photorhabdus heterorhabditis subsp. aluminescens]